MTQRPNNFSRATKVAAVTRATHGGCVYCEGCGLPCKKFDIDHIIPVRMGGDCTLKNAQVLCTTCHQQKTRQIDLRDMAQAKRREAADLGIKQCKRKIRSRGFPKHDTPRAIDKSELSKLPYRRLYE